MKNQQISGRISRLAAMMTLLEENPYKIRAFERGARIIHTHPEEMSVLIDEDRLKLVDGIGDSLAHLILHYAKSGGTVLEQELEAQLPEGLIDLLDLPGLGLKKVQSLWHEHQIITLTQLHEACEAHRLAQWKGFGEKLEAQLLAAMAFKARHARDFHLDRALQVAQDWLQKLQGSATVVHAELTGQIRRANELIQRIDILVEAETAALATEFPDAEVSQEEDTPFLQFKDGSGIPVRLWPTDHNHYYSQLLLLTGGEVYLSQRGQDFAFQNLDTDPSLDSEAACCTRLGIQWIEPELRDSYSSFPLDRSLVNTGDIKGVFHAHSTWSDGRNSLEEMVSAVIDRGYQYFGISEHSQAAYYANGLQPERVRAQWARIDELNQQFAPFRIFKGIEADILSDGRLDYDETLLAGFDFVIASVHSHFHLDPIRQTDRIIRALQSPFTTILGHPTGRMLLAREGYRPDLPAIIEAAAEFHKIIEINTTPKRLDLDWRHLKQVADLGVKVSINPDAHRVSSFDTIPLGVLMARKGGLVARDVINTLDRSQMEGYLAGRKPA